MSLAYPETFAEAFWKPQVDASKYFDDEVEKSLDPYIKGLLATVTGLEGVPQIVVDMLNNFATPGHFGLKDIGKAIAGQAGTSVIQEGLAPPLRLLQYAINAKLPVRLIEVDNAATLLWRKQIQQELYEFTSKANGYSPDVGKAIYKSLLPYPEITDMLAWARYVSDDQGTLEQAREFMDVPEQEYPIWDWLSRLRVSPSDVQALFTRGFIQQQDAINELRRDGYSASHATSMLELAWQIPNPTILLQSSLFRNEPFDFNEKYVQIGGIHPDYVPHYIDGVLVKPDITSIVDYVRRIDPAMGNLDTELKRIGVHPEYFDVFRTLAYPIPPVADLITMAVREAFSPAIASRFGQYEDYPQDLTRFAAMQGISEEWAQRYWAAHWSLPSPQQGFEMLHRGVITEADLELLLRALDVMPYWRDKLIAISYNPITRVDVRRMYSLGVLNESEVEKAYRDIGYTRENAERLREFTIRQSIASQSGMSVSKIITSYKQGLTDRTTAYNAISRLGVRAQNISDILESADLQRDWQRTKDRIASVRNRFKQEIIEESAARRELLSVGIDSVKVDSLIAQWITDGIESRKTLLSKTDVLTLLKKGKVTRERATQELCLLGYNAERITLLIKTTED